MLCLNRKSCHLNQKFLQTKTLTNTRITGLTRKVYSLLHMEDFGRRWPGPRPYGGPAVMNYRNGFFLPIYPSISHPQAPILSSVPPSLQPTSAPHHVLFLRGVLIRCIRVRPFLRIERRPTYPKACPANADLDRYTTDLKVALFSCPPPPVGCVFHATLRSPFFQQHAYWVSPSPLSSSTGLYRRTEGIHWLSAFGLWRPATWDHFGAICLPKRRSL